MKHIHITDQKKRLANEIHQETTLLMEQESDRDTLIIKMTHGKQGYVETQQIQEKLRVLKNSIKNREQKINLLQKQHDSI